MLLPNEAYERFRSEKYFVSLDGLRCISIVAVIWHHTAGMHFFADTPVLNSGHLGVEFFFAISGFLITTLLLREREQHGEISLVRFYIRRTLRIFPLYYTIVAVYVILTVAFERHTLEGQTFFSNLPYFLSYTSNIFVQQVGEQRVIFLFAWSLATEEQFYLVWPWVERFFGGSVSQFIMLLIVIVVECALLWGLWGVLDPTGLPLLILKNIAPAICMGVLLAHFLHYQRTFDIAMRFIGERWSSILMFAVTLLLVAVQPENPVLVPLAMVLTVGSTVIRNEHLLAGALTIPIAKHIGVVSYGMYLMHMIAYNLVMRVCAAIHVENQIVHFLLTLTFTVAVATISFRYYESIFQRMRSGLEQRFVPSRSSPPHKKIAA